MENFIFRINVLQNFGGVKVKAGYELLFTFMNCRKDFLKFSPSFPTSATIILPASINGTREAESWGVHGRECNSFKDPKT